MRIVKLDKIQRYKFDKLKDLEESKKITSLKIKPDVNHIIKFQHSTTTAEETPIGTS